MKNPLAVYSTIVLLVTMVVTTATKANTPSDNELIRSQMQALSESMHKDGGGQQAYAAILSPDFSRWTVGSDLINNRTNWLQGISDWFKSGWRVSHSENDVLELLVKDNQARVRRVVTETFVGPAGEQEIYQTSVVELWVKQQKQWLLQQANVAPKKIK